MKTYYELLGIADSASQEEIKSAYQKLIMNKNLNIAEKQILEDAFEVLADIERRRIYDQAVKDSKDDQDSNLLDSVASNVAKTAVPLPVNSPEMGQAKITDNSQSVDQLQWSGWGKGFSFRFGRMPLGLAVFVAFILDAFYSVTLFSIFGPDRLNEIVFMPVFLISIIFSPIIASQKGRHWLFWSIISLGGGIMGPMFPNHGPFSHVVLLTLILAMPGKPRCPNPECGKLIERFVANCPNCGIDLRSQPT